MIPVSFFLAWRLLKSGSSEKNISFMLKISMISIMIGTFALALVFAIMQGFERATHAKLQGIHADIIIKARGMGLDYAKIKEILEREFASEIAACAPMSVQHALVQPSLVQTTGFKEGEMPLLLGALIGIDPVAQERVARIPVIEGDGIGQESVLVGAMAQQQLAVMPGDQLDLFYMGSEKPKKRKVTLETSLATVGGVFKTGIDEFDANVIFCSQDFLESLFPHSEVTQINVRVQQGVEHEVVIDTLRKRFKSLDIFSWKDLYPALVSALILEKYAMFFILALITLVASMNIVALLFMYIVHKKSDIALLEAMGLPQAAIQRLFIVVGMTISALGTGIGLLLAWFASWLLERYPFIQLPDVYYVTHLPAYWDWHIVVSVTIVTLIVSFLASWLPARSIKTFSIAQILKFGE